MDVKKLKASRTARLVAFTKRVNKALQLMKENASTLQMTTIRDEISGLIQNCDTTNQAYIEKLSEETAIDEAYLWFVDVETTASDCLRDIADYLKDYESDDDPDISMSSKSGVKTQSLPVSTSKPTIASLDEWIDELTPYAETVIPKPDASQAGTYQELMLRAMLERDAPKAKIEPFDGSAIDWPKFVDIFHEEVHRQPYFKDTRRMWILQDSVTGAAKQHIKGYGTDGAAYAIALKALKSRFGHRVRVARAFLHRVTDSPAIREHDRAQLEKFYIEIRDCIFSLRRMNYESDMANSGIVRRATARIPVRMRERWAERCRVLRSTHEPSLEDLEAWLSDRVTAAFDPILLGDDDTAAAVKPYNTSSTRGKGSTFHTVQKPQEPDRSVKPLVKTLPPTSLNEFSHLSQNDEPLCVICKTSSHAVHRCPDYLVMTPTQRFESVNLNKLCRNCLRPGHRAIDCISKSRCRAGRCNRRHHTSIHDVPRAVFQPSERRDDQSPVTDQPNGQRSQSGQSIDAQTPEPSPVQTNLCGFNQQSKSRVYLQILPVTITSPSGEKIYTHALLDNGSHLTMIRKDLASQLNLSGPTEELEVGTIARDEDSQSAQKVSFSVSGVNDGEPFKVPLAWAVDKLNIPPQRYGDFATLPHLSDLNLPEAADVGLLIGGNVPDVLIPVDFRRGPPGTPYAIKTALGWSLLGPLADPTTKLHRHYCSFTYATSSDHSLNELLQQFWTTESFGCKYDDKPATSVDDRNAQSLLDRETIRVSGHYAVPMLWKHKDTNMPPNYFMALKRYQTLCRKLRTDPDRFGRYSGVINTWIQNGYARKMTDAEIRSRSPITWYLPHHDVYNVNKPNKTRVVQDCAAKCKGVSLNDMLVTGPDLLNSLTGVLLNFRRGVIGFSADIEAMFHRVFCLRSDTDCLRFLWSEDLNIENPDTYQMLVNVFGAKCSPTCANYALRRLASDGIGKFSPTAIETVLRYFYMDDLCHSQPSVESAITLSKELIDLLQTAGFRLTKWSSNSRELLAALPASEIANKDINLDFDSLPNQRVLGFIWDTNDDVLTFKSVKTETPMTKRGILRTVATLFDPCGICAPFVLIAKELMQSMWKLSAGWDDQLPDEIYSASGSHGWTIYQISRRFDFRDVILQTCGTRQQLNSTFIVTAVKSLTVVSVIYVLSHLPVQSQSPFFYPNPESHQ